MKNKKISLIILILFVFQALVVSLAPIPASQANHNDAIDLEAVNEYDVSETNLNRVDTTIDMFPNGGFEDWLVPHEPKELSIVRTQMIEMDLEYSIVSEGARSARLMSMGTDAYHPAYAYLFLQSWSSLNNPANLTVSFDYYIDILANPDLGDCLELYLPFTGSGRHIYYRIGSSVGATNTSTYAYYLLESGPVQQWNTFIRNVTRDYVAAFGVNPGYLGRFQFHVVSHEYEWVRAYIDNVYFANGSYVKVGGSVNSGNFETGYSGSWWWGFDYDQGSGDISQSTTRVEGDWSLNMTINTRGYLGFARFGFYVNKIPTILNKDQFSFYWNIADWQISTYNSQVYMWVNYNNVTHEGLRVFYIFGYGGGPQTLADHDDIEIAVDGFNTTGTWNLFDRSIIDDIHTRYPNAEVSIKDIYFYSCASDVGSRITILFDNASLVTSILHDGGYEDQGDIGEPIYGWGDEFDIVTGHTVTDFSCNGEKAANITITDDTNFDRMQYFGNLPIDESKEMILDLNWYIEAFNQSSKDYLAILLYFNENSRVLFFSLANASALDYWGITFDEYLAYVPMPETNTFGSWINWQIDIVHTYEAAFGEVPNEYTFCIQLFGAVDTDSKLTVFMDDFYIYEDPAPEVTDVNHTPMSPVAGGSVLITANAIDATLKSVKVNYQINGGSWFHPEMNHISGNQYELTITDLPADTEVEYSITAVDAYDKSFTAMDDGDYFSFVVEPSSTTTTTTTTTTTSTQTVDGSILTMAVVAVAVVAILAVFIIYTSVIKKR